MPKGKYGERAAPRMLLVEKVLGDILDLHLRLHEITYANASFLIGAAGVILTLLAVEVLPNSKELNLLAKGGVGVIALAAILSLAINIGIIDPKIDRKVKRKNLFYFKGFLDQYSIDGYASEVSKLLKSEDYIIEQYAKEVYDLSRNVLEPKFRLLKQAAWILLGGIVAGSILIFASLLI